MAIVKNLANKDYQLLSINQHEKRIRLHGGIVDHVLRIIERPWRGYLFNCFLCKRWNKFSDLGGVGKDEGKGLMLVCADCIAQAGADPMDSFSKT